MRLRLAGAMKRYPLAFSVYALTLALMVGAIPVGLSVAPAIAAPPPVNPSPRVNFEKHFRDLGVRGSVLIYDQKGDRTFDSSPQRNQTPFPPASTFKILNSLIALETGVIGDEISVLTWDGVTRELPQWNRDLNMREAFKTSAVWFYQVLARRVGYETMQSWLTKVDYGNHEVGGKDNIDQFWLNGNLQITPQEQVNFLRRLYRGDLPFRDRTMAIVKDIMIAEQTPHYVLRGKTGWYGFGRKDIPHIGWYVGYLEQNKNVYFFAVNLDLKDPQDAPDRIELIRRCFQDLGLL